MKWKSTKEEKEIATEALPLSTPSNAEMEEDPEEEASSEETLSEIVKAARLVYKRRKAATSTLVVEKLTSSSQQNDEKDEAVETEEASRKRGKGKDIAIIASVLKAQNVEKMAFRPISIAKFFDFENLKTKGWDLRKFTDPQGWSAFLSTEESTFEDLVKEFYGHMAVKEKKEEKVLVSSVKGVKITIT